MVNAKVNIYNSQNVRVTISVYGESNLPFGYMPVFRQMEELNLKSLTFVYVKDALPSDARKSQNSIGNRQKGDQLIHFESRNVTNSNRFPSRGFHYSGHEYITYVGFSFNVRPKQTILNMFS